MTIPRRHTHPPPLNCLSRATVDTAYTPAIDAVLKQLKSSTRRLQAALASHRTELQVLERLYYKGKNQHRTALFWQRVAEMRKYGERVDEMHIDDVVESLRLAFWGDPSSRTLGSASFMHTTDGCAPPAPNRSFTLMMQSGAFLQLVLTLAAIASRLSILLSEVRGALEVAWSAAFRVLQTTFPTYAGKVRQLVKGLPLETPPAPGPSRTHSKSKTPPADPGPGEFVDEDLGSSLARPPTSLAPEENVVDTFDADATALSLSDEHPQPPDSMSFSLSNELAQSIEQSRVPSPAIKLTEETPAPAMPSAPKRKKTDGEGSKPAKKKKKKRDEIDDIFGF
ncbi:hypothetical protein ONZ51_g4428 [Trametes cubensis]|uniref:Nucleolus and neural progenitor protein-like N-terminal domain-containing protein n=1 Tax=Trametes cubensis TaxID=1111947 RepID=A0AAD7TVS5_9APHY|nr:hypothetical protein ONZ51_g4428 [Trametes cubensis]